MGSAKQKKAERDLVVRGQREGKERKEGRGEERGRDGIKREMYRKRNVGGKDSVHTDNTKSCTVAGCHLCNCAAMHQTTYCILGS